MLSFIDPGLFPGRETVREGPAIDYEANATKDGNTGILQAPESGGKRVQVAGGEEGGVSVEVAGGGVSTATSRDGERFCPGVN